MKKRKLFRESFHLQHVCFLFVSYCFRDYCTIVCFYFERTTLEISVLHFSVILSCYPWNCLDFVLFILNFTHGTETKYVF